MSALRLIRNARVVAKLAKWPSNLPPPIYASDNHNKAVAVSFLRSLTMRDGEPVHCCDLTNEHAADIAKWCLLRPAV